MRRGIFPAILIFLFILPVVSAYPAINFNARNWTTSTCAGLTIGFNETTDNVTIYYGTGDWDSLDNVITWDLSYNGTRFFPVIEGLDPGTTYQYVVHPNLSASGNYSGGNFTTRASTIYSDFYYSFHNQSYSVEDSNQNVGGRNVTSADNPFNATMMNWWADTGESWTENDGIAGFDTSSTGDLYFQARMCFNDSDGDGLVVQDQGLGWGFWGVGGGAWTWQVLAFNDSARDKFEWWVWDAAAWTRLVGQEPINLDQWYNVTLRVEDNARNSVQGATWRYWVQIDNNGSTGDGSWYGPYDIDAWLDDGELYNMYIEPGGDVEVQLGFDLVLVQNATFLSNYLLFGQEESAITLVNQSETNPWHLGGQGWVNVTLRHSEGWANLSVANFQINTTGDAETFTLRWNRSGYTLTEINDPSAICTLNAWDNITSGNNVQVRMNITIASSATAGYCDKYVNATGDGGLSFSDTTNNAFLLRTFPAVNFSARNWTTARSVGLTVGFNQSVTNVTIYYGTEDHGSLSNVITWTGLQSAVKFYPVITGLDSGTTYNFTINPNVSTSIAYADGNFTTRESSIIEHFAYAFWNNTYSDEDTNQNLGMKNASNITLPSMFHWQADTGEAWTDTKGGVAFDTGSLGNLYFQKRVGFYDDDGDGLVTQDQGAGFGFWFGAGWTWQVLAFNDSARDKFEWWVWDAAAWTRLVGQEEISFGQWYNITVNVSSNARNSVQGATWEYWVQIDNNGSGGLGTWYGPFDVDEWLGDGWLINSYIEPGGDFGAQICSDLSLAQNATFISNITTFGPLPAPPSNISWVNQSETHPWTVNTSGWINLTLSHDDGWQNLSIIDIQVNTTGDAQNFTLRWNRTGYTLTEKSDLDGIVTINTWANYTAGNDVFITANLTIWDNATTGWCDKYINATGDGNLTYSNLTNNVFQLVSLVPAQGNITIWVIDNESKQPISGATVWLWNSTWADSEVSDISGYVHYYNVANGTYSLNGSALWYITNTTTIPTAPDNLFGLWNLTLEPIAGNWTTIWVVDSNLSVGIPNALVGIWNGTWSMINRTNCNGTLRVRLHDGAYNINSSAPYLYAFNSSNFVSPTQFTMFMIQNHINANPDAKPAWNWYFPYDEPWPGNGEIMSLDNMDGWVTWNEVEWVTETSAMIIVEYKGKTNQSIIRFQNRDPPANDVPPSNISWGDTDRLERNQWVHINHGVMMTSNYRANQGDVLNGSRWIHVLDGLYPGKSYYYSIYPALAVWGWGAVYSFTTKSAPAGFPNGSEYAFSFGNDTSWLDRRGNVMQGWGEAVNFSYEIGAACGQYSMTDVRRNWDHYWHGSGVANPANATGLTNIVHRFGNNSDVRVETRMTNYGAPAANHSGTGGWYTVETAEYHPSQPYMGEGTAVGLWNPQTETWVARVALANLSGAAPGSSIGAGFFGWNADLGRFVRGSDTIDFWGDWRLYNTWWNVTIVLPREAFCGSVGALNYSDYNYDVYISGPPACGASPEIENRLIGSYPLGAPVSNGLIVVYEYLPNWEWASNYFGGIVPANIDACFDWTWISNSTYEIEDDRCQSSLDIDWDPDGGGVTQDNESVAPPHSLYPKYYSVGMNLWTINHSDPYYIGEVIRCDNEWDGVSTYNLFERMENNIYYAETNETQYANGSCLYRHYRNITYLWFDVGNWAYLNSSQISWWPTQWLIVAIWDEEFNGYHDFYLDVAYIGSGSAWLHLGWCNLTVYDPKVAMITWNNDTVTEGFTEYYGHWDLETYRYNWTWADFTAYGYAAGEIRPNFVNPLTGFTFDLAKPYINPWDGATAGNTSDPERYYPATTEGFSFYDPITAYPYGPSLSTPMEGRALDPYTMELFPNDASAFGTSWYTNSSGGWQSYINEAYIRFDVERGNTDFITNKVIYLSNATDLYLCWFPENDYAYTRYTQVWIMGVDDVDSTPEWTDHTYWVTDPSFDIDYNEHHIHWYAIPGGEGPGAKPYPTQMGNITLPTGYGLDNDQLFLPNISIWNPNSALDNLGYWMSDTWSESSTGGLAVVPNKSLWAADMYYEVFDVPWGAERREAIVNLHYNSTILNHTDNPSEPYLQFQFGALSGLAGGHGWDDEWAVTKVCVGYNETGVYWGLMSQVWMNSHDIWGSRTLGDTYYMTNMDLEVWGDWTDHTYGLERNDTEWDLYHQWYLPAFGQTQWDVVSDVGWWHLRGPHILNASQNITLPLGHNATYGNRTDTDVYDGHSYGMSEPSDWVGAGVEGGVDTPYWARAVDLFGFDMTTGTFYAESYGPTWVGTVFVNSSRFDEYTSVFNGTKGFIEFQNHDAGETSAYGYYDVNKIVTITNATGDYIDFYKMERRDVSSIWNTFTVIAARDKDSTPQWDDHSYDPHHDESGWWWVGGGGGWDEYQFNWTLNETLPSQKGFAAYPDWNDANWALGNIYNGSAWAGWTPEAPYQDPMNETIARYFMAIDEFDYYRGGYGIIGILDTEYDEPLKFQINGTWAGVNGTYLTLSFDNLGDVGESIDKIWFRRNSTGHLVEVAFRSLGADMYNYTESPVWLYQPDHALYPYNDTWDNVYVVDVVDANAYDLYWSNWTVYPVDFDASPLPHHDPTSPLTHYEYPLNTFYADWSQGFNRWHHINQSFIFLTDGNWCPEPNPTTVAYAGASTMSFFNASSFGVENLGSYMCAEWADPGGNAGNIWVKAYGHKENATGHYVGFYLHGGYYPKSEVYISVTFHITDWSPYDQEIVNGKGFNITGPTDTYTVNATAYNVPPNGRWIWFYWYFWRFAIARVSYRTNEWQSPSAFDYYETVPVMYLKKIDAYGPPPVQYLVITNSTGDVTFDMEITQRPDMMWDVQRMARGSLEPGIYNVSILVGSHNWSVYSRNLTIFRSNITWGFEYGRFVYGGATHFTLRANNWLYWSEEMRQTGYFRPNLTDDDVGELECMMIVRSLPTGYELGRTYFVLYNDTLSHERRDIISDEVGIVLPNPGSMGYSANVSIYARMIDDSWVHLYNTTVTLQSTALYGEAFEALGQWLGFSPDFARMIVAIFGTCMLALGMGHVAGLGARGFSVVILIGFWTFTIAGWFPVWLAIFASLGAIGSFMYENG